MTTYNDKQYPQEMTKQEITHGRLHSFDFHDNTDKTIKELISEHVIKPNRSWRDKYITQE